MDIPAKKCLAVLGGDEREIILIKLLLEQGYEIKTFGLPKNLLPSRIHNCTTCREAVNNAEGVILPMPGVNDLGILYTKLHQEKITISREDLAGIKEHVPVLVGRASCYLKELAASLGFFLIEVAELDEIAIPNAVPTAEGAIQLAMEKTPMTIHGSRALVIGYGRIGEALAIRLKCLGAKVTVCARNKIQLAKCHSLAYDTKTLAELSDDVHLEDLIFNTVPALIINEQVLQQVKKEVWIIDLASHPGGTDFEAAKRLGISAVLAPGLPGKVAPLTAGRILAEAYPGILATHH
ncbi:dipicolinate synthase subunit DpsA [Dehalobacterium formicoaceticum]|uniref:Dipicolinate synthase subunit DpsA n=1 Tax=Dehalobacterium formicoaceticum TaxID=51515 RepID=A0ABT1Y4V5_9FIRM|nr:dipicolinate synthase subunit DpsA [Dehalobacterium formicoaceticum]MCR6545907.1 dipicolinate synthase subunit DpsA [Dehalobacterium formicoaceticum]